MHINKDINNYLQSENIWISSECKTGLFIFEIHLNQRGIQIIFIATCEMKIKIQLICLSLLLVISCSLTEDDQENIRTGICEDLYCANCTGDVAVCIQCEPTYYVSTEFDCRRCLISQCAACPLSDVTNKTQCSKCIATYYLTTNKTCASCVIKKCDTCYLDDTKKTVCTKCSSSFYLGNNNTCISCGIDLCDICTVQDISNTTQCSKCVTSSYSTGNNTCISCGITKCDTCTPLNTTNGTNGTQCNKCQTSSYYRNNTCLSCLRAIRNCIRCYDQTSINQTIKCYECFSRFIQNDSTLCLQCGDIIANCSRCYFLNQTTQTVGCLACSSSYYLKGNSCLSCGIQNCGICSEDAGSNAGITCNKCKNSSYVLSNNRCLDCGQVIGECLVCSVNSCIRCDNGKIPSNDGKSCEADVVDHTTLIIVLSVVGVLFFIGVAVGISRYWKKKKALSANSGVSLQQNEEYQRI